MTDSSAGSGSPSTLNSSVRSFSRREFLRTAALAGLAAPMLMSCRTTQHRPRVISPNEKLNHACIGVGGMGWNDFQNFLEHKRVQIVALCDVDSEHLEKAAKVVPGARLYSDWRELLHQEGSRIDSVNVTVPDHMHFAIAYSAIQNGKHVYCQKPMCHDVEEVRTLTRAAVAKGVVTQLGTQFASLVHDRTGVIWLKENRVGKITHAYLCSNRPGADKYRLAGPRPAVGQEPPPTLNWDLWTGTAPKRLYAPGLYHPGEWRSWQDFGTGWSGDIGCHIFDAVWKGLGLHAPLSVQAEVQQSWQNSPERRADTWPQSNHITWIFPGKNDRIQGDELVAEWFDGDFYPPDHIRKLYSQNLQEYPAESAMLIGTEGAMLIPHQYPPQLLPEEKFQSVKRPQLPPRNHYHHFVDACLGGESTESYFAQTGPMTEAILLGTVAIRMPGQKLSWDSARMTFPNQPEAKSYLKRKYRDGWHEAKF